MSWEVEFYGNVDNEILELPPGIQARMIKLLEMIETHSANRGAPHTKPLGKGLFEVRARAKEGIGRGCTVTWMVSV